MSDLPPNPPSNTPGPPPGRPPGAPPGLPPGPPPGRPPNAGPPMPSGPVGWYSGPVPFQGLVARESIGRAVGRTVAKVIAALATLAIGGLAMLVLLAALIGGLAGTAAPADELAATFIAGDEGNDNTLLAIPVTGLILGESEGGDSLFSALAGVTYGYDVKADLEAAADRDDIKGVVLELDTPGGTIFGSKAIADAVAAYQEKTGRPVVAFVRGLSASGGMYAMAGADHIVADHGTLVGSIGVIFGPLTRYDGVIATDGGLFGGGVETTGGITEEYITAGRSKDLGNPYRALTDEERGALQTSVDNSYGAFVQHVATGRYISAETIRTSLGALIYDEQAALTNGLIDEVGNRDLAYAKAAELAQLAPGNWQVERLTQGGGGLFGLGALLGTDGGAGRNATAPGVDAVDPRTLLCNRGPMMLAYYGSLPTACG